MNSTLAHHIQQLLGHEVLSTTSGFYAFATLDTLLKSLEKAKPFRHEQIVEKQGVFGETLQTVAKLS